MGAEGSSGDGRCGNEERRSSGEIDKESDLLAADSGGVMTSMEGIPYRLLLLRYGDAG